MFDPIRSFDGYVMVQQVSARGMVSLRGDLASAKLKTAVKKLTGLAVPKTGEINQNSKFATAWMSPDELLILTPFTQSAPATAALASALRASHHLAINISDARATFTLTGAQASEVIAKLSPAQITPGQFRRSRLAQVPVAFWFSKPDQITLIAFRSVADYVFALLKTAAHPDSQVDYP